MFKTCSSCGIEQPLSSFSRNGTSKKGTPVLRSNCKACESARLANARNSDPKYNSKQAEARKRRQSDKAKYEVYVKSLTFTVKCTECGTDFIVTTLPEKPAKLLLVCNKCNSFSEGKSKEK